MNKITNVTLACDDNQQTAAHKVIEFPPRSVPANKMLFSRTVPENNLFHYGNLGHFLGVGTVLKVNHFIYGKIISSCHVWCWICKFYCSLID